MGYVLLSYAYYVYLLEGGSMQVVMLLVILFVLSWMYIYLKPRLLDLYDEYDDGYHHGKLIAVWLIGVSVVIASILVVTLVILAMLCMIELLDCFNLLQIHPDVPVESSNK